MRPIGFSTGALAYADFRRGLEMSLIAGCQAIELSALRAAELFPLLDALPHLDLSTFSYKSIHAPSQVEASWEATEFQRLYDERDRGWPVVVHPDTLFDLSLWRLLGPLTCIENMDKRKPIGRTAKELDWIFKQLPEATLCFDIGHARQCDPTMTGAYLILREFGSKLRQVHVSEVNAASKHDPLSYASIMAFQDLAHLIPAHIPLILETPTKLTEMAAEITKVREALPVNGKTVFA
jgi:hypothetical protein